MSKKIEDFTVEAPNIDRARIFTTRDGLEIPDPTPMQPPLGYKRAPSLAEQIRQGIIAAKLDELYDLEETDEEADDFNIEDEMEPISPHENDHVPSLAELREQARLLNAEIEKKRLEDYKERHDKLLAEKGGRQPPQETNTETPPSEAEA